MRRRVFYIILLRLISNCAIVWGMFLLVPSFFGFFISGFAAPLLLEDEGRIVPLTIKGIKWVNNSSRRLIRLLAGFILLFMLILLGVFVLQHFLLGPVFSSILVCFYRANTSFAPTCSIAIYTDGFEK